MKQRAGESLRATDPATPLIPPDRAWLHARWLADSSQRAMDAQRLHAALAEFDAAPISTLHALCSRILVDHPFAAGAPSRGREMIDGRTLEAALADDLWRVVSQGDEGDELVRLGREVDAADPKNPVSGARCQNTSPCCCSRMWWWMGPTS